MQTATHTTKDKIEVLQRSGLRQFLKKVSDDQITNLASLLAWNTLNTVLPLLLGVLAVAGLVLRDPARLDEVYNTLLSVLPDSATAVLTPALTSVREEAVAPAGIISLVLLLYNGSNFFANLETVFDLVYHVPTRNVVLQHLFALGMLVLVTTLMVLAIAALSIGGLLGTLPIALPFGPTVGRVVSWAISGLAAFLMFLLVYRIIPNVKQGWRNVVPGTVLSVVAFFVILQVFPLYVRFFPPNHAYAAFGIFLVLTFWLYLLGITFALGAEVNAFLLDPARSVALAEVASRAQQGRAEVDHGDGEVRAHATGTAPSYLANAGLPRGRDSAQNSGYSEREQGMPSAAGRADRGSSFPGKLVGLIGLLAAAALLRGQTRNDQTGATRP